MNAKREVDRRQKKNQEVRQLVHDAKKICSTFFKNDYRYSDIEAIEELGLDDELIHQLVEDYVIQILTSIAQFEELIYDLQAKKDAKVEFSYTQLRELAHKNLGVARNLRIKDAEILLKKLMTEDDLEILFKSLEILRACAIRLKPECAYNTLKLIEVKSQF